jgi:hypothetical protein
MERDVLLGQGFAPAAEEAEYPLRTDDLWVPIFTSAQVSSLMTHR